MVTIVAPNPAYNYELDPNYQPPPGRVGNLSVPQQHALEKFRRELKDEGWLDEKRHDDAKLLRFLRARKFDLTAAKTMMIAQEKWRKDFGVDEITKTFMFTEKPEVNKYYQQYFHKTDKDGRPLYIERLGKVNMAEMNKVTSQDRLLKNLVNEYEKMETGRFPASAAAVRHPVETSCTILDLGGVGIKQFWDVKNYVFETSKIGQDRYPEQMGKFFVVNSPWGFSTIWNLIKGWLDPVTQEKIKIPGNNWKAVLLEAIPAENLPSDLGGACECAGGCSLSDAGPWNVPHEHAKVNGNKEEVIKTGAAT